MDKVILNEVRSKSTIVMTEELADEILELLNIKLDKGDGLIIRCERLKTDLTNDPNMEFDTIGYFYAEHKQPLNKKVPIYKYFKYDHGTWVQIGPDEYRNRVVRHERCHQSVEG